MVHINLCVFFLKVVISSLYGFEEKLYNYLKLNCSKTIFTLLDEFILKRIARKNWLR